jgi:hypothetical protein
MKILKTMLAFGASAALPMIATAQTANDVNSPTASADAGVQKATPTATPLDSTASPSVDQTTTSSTTDQSGGATDTGTPKDTATPSPTP